MQLGALIIEARLRSQAFFLKGLKENGVSVLRCG
jgi:hypothetical protein